MVDVTNDILDRVEAELDTDAEIRRNYSGRFMYGDHCLGVVANGIADVIAVMSRIIDENARAEGENSAGLVDMTGEDAVYQLQSMMEGMRYDSMGTSTIWYFPTIQVS